MVSHQCAESVRLLATELGLEQELKEARTNRDVILEGWTRRPSPSVPLADPIPSSQSSRARSYRESVDERPQRSFKPRHPVDHRVLHVDPPILVAVAADLEPLTDATEAPLQRGYLDPDTEHTPSDEELLASAQEASLTGALESRDRASRLPSRSGFELTARKTAQSIQPSNRGLGESTLERHTRAYAREQHRRAARAVPLRNRRSQVRLLPGVPQERPAPAGLSAFRRARARHRKAAGVSESRRRGWTSTRRPRTSPARSSASTTSPRRAGCAAPATAAGGCTGASCSTPMCSANLTAGRAEVLAPR